MKKVVFYLFLITFLFSDSYHYLLEKTKNFIATVKTPLGKTIWDGVVINDSGFVLVPASKAGNHLYYSINIKNKEYPAVISGYLKKYDLAILKLKKLPLNLHFAKKSDQNLKIGDEFFAISKDAIFKTMISFKHKEYCYLDLNPSNSKQFIALFNKNAKIVGLRVKSKDMKSLSCIVPFKSIKKDLAKKIQEYKKIDLFFGMVVKNIDKRLFPLYGYNSGVIVVSLKNKNSAKNAGLIRGDLIVSANKKKVKNIDDFLSVVSKHSKEDNISITFIRNKIHKKTVIKYQKIDTTLLNPDTISYKGMTLEALDKKMKTLLRVPPEINGVYVVFVDHNSTAKKVNIKMGDVIFQIDHKTIKDIKDIKYYKQDEKRRHRIFLYRKGWSMNIYFWT